MLCLSDGVSVKNSFFSFPSSRKKGFRGLGREERGGGVRALWGFRVQGSGFRIQGLGVGFRVQEGGKCHWMKKSLDEIVLCFE